MRDAARLPADAPEADARLSALHARGAAQRDPSSFAFLDALARRTAQYRGAVRRQLDARLSRALADFAARLDAQAHPAAVATLAGTCPGPEAAATPSPLTALLRDLAARPAPPQDPGAPPAAYPAPAAVPGTLPELKAVDYFRDRWSQLSLEQQFAQAMAQAPDNAGPLNSHLLILRALQCMRDISPDYLYRFMTYADALLWLDQATGGGLPSSRPVVRDSDTAGEAKADSPRKPARPRKRAPK